jgi:uncharacterized protein
MAMRFLCDEMLVRLARLLRAAGYDAAMAEPGAPDSVLLARAAEEDRILLTRDKRLAATPGALLVEGRGASEEAAALSGRLPIDWSHAPFSRCVIDNALLRSATTAEIGRMPASARLKGGPFRACPRCGRIYWPGSHVQRMAARLRALPGFAKPPAPTK